MQRKGAALSSLLVVSFAFLLVAASTVESTSVACGVAGAPKFSRPVIKPLSVTNVGTAITVTNSGDAVNGDVSSVQALISNPGPDGISLIEALTATNNSPGTFTITFAQSLKGAEIVVGNGLPVMTGGNVLINGDIDGDGRPDISITNSTDQRVGFHIGSSGNTINGFTIKGFAEGVEMLGYSSPKRVFENETVSNSVFYSSGGINIGLGASANNSRWSNITIQGDTFHTEGDGVDLAGTSNGFVLSGVRIINNSVIGESRGFDGISFQAGTSYNQDNATIQGVDIYGNSFVGEFGYAAVYLGSGLNGASHNTIRDVNISENQIAENLTLSSTGQEYFGIFVSTADGASDTIYPQLTPVVYPQWNVVEGISIMDNSVSGIPGDDVLLSGGCCGAAHNKVSDVRVEGNSFSPLVYGNGASGVFAIGGGDGGFFTRPSTLNNVTGVMISHNTVAMVSALQVPYDYVQSVTDGGIVLFGGTMGDGNSVTNVTASVNLLTGAFAGATIIGGSAQGNQGESKSNSVSGVDLACNSIPDPPSQVTKNYSWAKGIDLVGGLSLGMGVSVQNHVGPVLLEGNKVAGVIDDLSVEQDVGSGATANAVTYSATTTSTTSSSTLSTTTSTTHLTTTSLASTETTTTYQTASTSLPSTTSSSTAGGTIPEFPYQVATSVAFVVVVILSYLLTRRRPV